jgi:cardiolipin synthase
MKSLPEYVDILILAIYILMLVYTIGKILLETSSTPKTLAYILLVTVFPLVGILFYFSFGINYRHSKSTKKIVASLEKVDIDYKKNVTDETQVLIKNNPDIFKQYDELANFIYRLGGEIMGKNSFTLLVNGEEKFPEVLKTLQTAKHFIHMEYYDWENDTRGNQIKDVLLKKVAEGVKVRVMYDDYASKNIRGNIVKELRAGGIEIHPVIKVRLVMFANRMNHRDHRKVIIVDGHSGFVGGINISDRYDNSIDTGLYWRDTHVKIQGTTVLNMQRHFLVNWNACQPNTITYNKDLFPELVIAEDAAPTTMAQVVAGGPVYPMSNIMLTYSRIFTLAQEKLYITNPYFIPNETILDALKQAAISGVDVRVMLPKKSDSAIVGAASKFYFRELLDAGVKIYLYRKGFVHAKTVVADTQLSVVGTANMDIRSFDLNFEIMSVIYESDFATQLEKVFLNDLNECDQLNYEQWIKQSTIKKLTYATARLISAVL